MSTKLRPKWECPGCGELHVDKCDARDCCELLCGISVRHARNRITGRTMPLTVANSGRTRKPAK